MTVGFCDVLLSVTLESLTRENFELPRVHFGAVLRDRRRVPDQQSTIHKLFTKLGSDRIQPFWHLSLTSFACINQWTFDSSSDTL